MWKKFKEQIFADLKIISLNYRFLISLGVLFLLIILILVCLPLVTHSDYLKYGLQPTKYYSLVSISLVALIPVFAGIVFGSINPAEMPDTPYDDLDKGAGNVSSSILFRALTCLVFSFLLIMLSIWLIKPVPTQGWLRTIYAALILSFQAPTAMLMYTKSGSFKDKSNPFLLPYWITIIMLPVGLMLHHPLNYPAFISPFYWSAWAWMIQSPVQSIICGAIALFLTAALCFVSVHSRAERN